MKTSDFDYDLSPKFIAQTPIEPRDSSRLLILRRGSGRIQHAYFRELSEFLNPGDLLVLNETRVIRARLFARKIPSGGKVELLLLRQEDEHTWETLVGGKGLRTSVQIQVDVGPKAEIVSVLSGSRRRIRFNEPILPILDQIGTIPIPPYIHSPNIDPARYQTVYARHFGSVAAPTAGLHFTPELIAKLKVDGIRFTSVTLHVGLDTFVPVTEEDPREHKIHTEWCQISKEVVEIVNETARSNNRVIAVGTTSVRTLETATGFAVGNEIIGEFEGPTDLFILPGYTFRCVDSMITNFHLPRSTLIMLVSAFAGRDRIMNAYQVAKRECYRFYSFGDAMLIL